MAFISKQFYDSIADDPKLSRAEKNLFKLLSSFWIKNGCKHLDQLRSPEVIKTRSFNITVVAGHKTLARKLNYKRSDYLAVLIKKLVAKRYINYIPGTGVAGQEMNISKFSSFDLLIPEHYKLPVQKRLEDAEALKWAKRAIVKIAGADMTDLNLIVATGLTNKAINKAKRKPSLANLVELSKSQHSLEAFKNNASKVERGTVFQEL